MTPMDFWAGLTAAAKRHEWKATFLTLFGVGALIVLEVLDK